MEESEQSCFPFSVPPQGLIDNGACSFNTGQCQTQSRKGRNAPVMAARKNNASRALKTVFKLSLSHRGVAKECGDPTVHPCGAAATLMVTIMVAMTATQCVQSWTLGHLSGSAVLKETLKNNLLPSQWHVLRKCCGRWGQIFMTFAVK